MGANYIRLFADVSFHPAWGVPQAWGTTRNTRLAAASSENAAGCLLACTYSFSMDPKAMRHRRKSKGDQELEETESQAGET